MSAEHKFNGIEDMINAMADPNQETKRAIAKHAFEIAEGLIIVMTTVQTQADEETDAIIKTYIDRLMRRLK